MFDIVFMAKPNISGWDRHEYQHREGEPVLRTCMNSLTIRARGCQIPRYPLSQDRPAIAGASRPHRRSFRYQDPFRFILYECVNTSSIEDISLSEPLDPCFDFLSLSKRWIFSQSRNRSLSLLPERSSQAVKGVVGSYLIQSAGDQLFRFAGDRLR